MSMINTAPAAASGVSLSTLRSAFADWRKRRAIFVRTYDELNALSNRELADLNISRADIRYLALQAAQQN